MKNIILLFILCLPLGSIAQKAKIHRAQTEFKKKNYESAALILEEVVKRRDTSVAHHLLGVSLMKIDSFNRAHNHLKKACADEDYSSILKYEDYAHCLMALERYQDALNILENNFKSQWREEYLTFLEKIITGTDSINCFQTYQSRKIIPKENHPYQYLNLVDNHAFLYYPEIYKNPESYHPIQDAKINFDILDTIPYGKANKYEIDDCFWRTTNADFTKLAIAHDYYNYINCSFGKYEIISKIYVNIGTNIDKPSFIGFPINSDEYNTTYPSFNGKGDTLYFSSDMPTGFGGMDLYYIVFDEEKQEWQVPINLGPHINTEFDEVYPFFHQKTSRLYFSTKGLPGYGGLDIFVVDDINNYPKAINLGKTINSSRDDFAFSLSQNQQYGFYSSKKGGVLKIYQFYKDE